MLQLYKSEGKTREDLNYLMRHFNFALNEMKSFNNYYEDYAHQDKVDSSELPRIIDIEDTHMKQVETYGELPYSGCKDCGFQEYGDPNKRIFHSF